MSPLRAPRVALVTCKVLPEPDPDQDLMLSALRAAGIDAFMLAWDDPHADPAGFDLWVLRSCWNYHAHPEDFLRWIDDAAAKTTLANPAPVVRGNIHKRYLLDLEHAGLPIVPTAFIDRGSAATLSDILAQRQWGRSGDIVIKPCISAGSANTRRFCPDQHAEADDFLRSLSHTRDMMVQPYLASVETGGERSVICIAGQPTHAIEKSPRFHDQDEHVSEAKPITPEDADLARRALATIPGPLLYARLDTMLGPAGERLISELELIEPSLFLLQSPPALAAFVDAVRNAAR